MSPEEKAIRVKQRAVELGFDAAGIADLSPIPHRQALDDWLATGKAGTMTYMHRQAPQRREPARIVAGTSRAIVVLKFYHDGDSAGDNVGGRVAKYARGGDYHKTLRAPLESLAGYVTSLGDPGTIARAFVDAGPVPERELAQRAGLGWIGKNTMLIDPDRGSYSFIASVLTNLDLRVDSPFDADRCGTCTRCLEACPTGAFAGERVLDSTRCISYLTIEHRGDIPSELASRMGEWVFGCDICQDVCPWNTRFAEALERPELDRSAALASINLSELLNMSDADFAERYGWTPLERPGAKGMRRNARVVLGNRG